MDRRVHTIVDVMRVPVEGDPLSAVIAIDHRAKSRKLSCDVLIVGGGMGGVAAAWALVRRGHDVCLLEETDWLGGQMTSQGIAALDEHEHIEQFGGTRSYYQLCEAIRDHYRALLPPQQADHHLNPGTCWVSRLAFEPSVAVSAIQSMLSQYLAAGKLRIFLRTMAVAAATDGDRVTGIRAINLDDGDHTHFEFHYVLDATELGDLLPLTGTEDIVGAESASQTSEPHAQPDGPRPHCVQSCTYPFALERRPKGEDHRIAKPTLYEDYRDRQPYSLRIHVHGGEIYGDTTGWLDYDLFDDTPGTKGPLWRYRRLVEAAQFPGDHQHDITMFNWPGNDYRDLPLVDQPPQALAQALQNAKRVSLGFAYWLQTQAPNAHGTPGFPQLRLRPDVMGSADGLSKYPYIRECRRIAARKTILEQEVAVASQPGPRAAHFDDAVGIGWYPIDIHQISQDEVGTSTRTRPFQIPLGALIPERVENLIAANKNIGTTHITNGCYRLHPVEWNIGEAAGMLAAFALKQERKPAAIHADGALLREFQTVLIDSGMPLCWLTDVPVGHPDFVAVQRLVVERGYGGRDNSLQFHPDEPISVTDRSTWLQHPFPETRTVPTDGSLSRAGFARLVSDAGNPA